VPARPDGIGTDRGPVFPHRGMDVAALIRFLASHFAVLAAERKIEFVVDAHRPRVAAVDPEKLQRAVMNLLANAFKFVPDGGRVRCRLAFAPGELTITVDDSGPGVRPELRHAIFERFRQGEGRSNRTTEGTGLELAIAKEFVEMHKGRVEVLDSDLGGARFQVSLRLNRLAPQESTHSLPAPAHPGLDRTTLDGVLEELRPRIVASATEPVPVNQSSRPRVLVVEDNPDMNRFVCECLTLHYDVISAFDGRGWLEKALRFRPALVLTDVMMPHVSGDEMIAQMRERPELRSTPVLLLSAKADEELVVRLLDEGAQDYIVKPFSEKDLAVRVRNLVLAVQAREEPERASRAKDEFLVTDGTNLWVVNDTSTDKVFKYNLSGTLLGSWTISGGGSSPTGITLDPSNVGNLWVVDSGTKRVYQFDNAASRTSGSQSPSTSFALAAGNTNPQGIADPPVPAAGASQVATLNKTAHPSGLLAAHFSMTIPGFRASKSTRSFLPHTARRPSVVSRHETPIVISSIPSTDQDITLLAADLLRAGSKRSRSTLAPTSV
jgi:DNA-binding response OmpR family regulator